MCLEQAINRISEMFQNDYFIEHEKVFPVLKTQNVKIMTVEITSGFKLSAKNFKDFWFSCCDKNVVKYVEAILTNECKLIVRGRCIINKENFFQLPISRHI